MDGDEAAAVLVLDHGYPVHLLPHLNRYLVRWIFGKRRDQKTGQIILRRKRSAAGDSLGRDGPRSLRDEFGDKWRAMGLAEHHIDQLYRQHFPQQE